MSRRLAVLAVAALCVAFLAMGAGSAWAGSTPTTPTEPYNNNGECLYCHQPGGSAVSTVSFPVDTSVNRATACMKCHWEQAGSHPFHNPTWNCSSCHREAGFTNPAAIPSVVTTYGYFYTGASAEADSRSLHIIHSNPTWAGSMTKNGRQCASCHAAAACTACHEDPDLTHAEHAWDVTLGDYWPGSGPNGKPYGSGTSVSNEYVRNVNSALTCSNPTCHMTASGDDAPTLVENYSSSLAYTGTWVRSSLVGYTGNSYSLSNALGAKAQLVFTGEKIEFISRKHPYDGKAKVSLDGVEVTTTDLYAPAVQKQFVAYTSGTLTSGPHTITVEVLRTKNDLSRDYFVVIDAFRVYPKLTLTLTNCTECHAPDTFTGAEVTRTAAHADPTAHIATETALSITTTSTVRASVSCTSACHLDRIDLEHASVIATASPAKLADGAISCTECHTDAKYTPFAAPGVGDWKKTCAECHAVRHDTFTAKHDFTSASGATCGAGAGTGCHEATRIDRIHYNATTTPDPTNNCNVCHKDDGKPLGTLNGGAPANECTDCHTGHGGKHTLLLTQSNYAESSSDGTATGCTNAGNGCHLSLGASNTSTDIADYHPTSGCTTGPCHTSASKPSHFEPFICGDCHDNSYVNALDTTALADLAPAGHYGDTTHTATSGLSTVSVSGTASETCSVCHNLSLKDAHTGIVSQTKGTKVTCNECHSYNASIVTEIKTNNWTNNRCNDCHTGSVIAISVQHPAAVTVVVTATASAGCASTGLNCHNTDDLHAVHKNAAAGCDLSGCHDAAAKNRKPTGTTCGAGGCHSTYTGTNHNGRTGNDTTHTAGANQANDTSFYSTACGTCHFTGLSSEHTKTTSAGAATCLACHNRSDSTTAIQGNWAARNTTGACAACHGVGTIPAAHSGNFTSMHTTTSAGCSLSGTGCHNTDNIATVTGLHSTCTRCHSTTYNPANKTCGNTRACHNSSYETATSVHNGTGGLADGNDSAHHTATLTAGQYTGADAVDSDSQACSLCHTGTMTTSHTNTRVGSVSCIGCHNSSVVATSPLVVKASWPTKKCTACHNSGATTHGSIESSHTGTGIGCASSGAGCHTTDDLKALHVGKGCTITGCHGVDKKMNTEVKTCGSISGGCHAAYTVVNHNGRTGNDTTHTANAPYMATQVDAAGTYQLACTGCHISTLGSEHTTVGAVTYGTSITCTECHNNTGSSGAPSSSVSVIKPGPWNDFCSACHTVTRTAGHATSTPGPHAVNDATQSVGAGGAWCTSCHTAFNSNVATYHSEAATTVVGTPYSTCNVCHRGSADTSLTTLFAPVGAWDCVDCHPGNRNSHGVSAGGLTCYGCHTTYQSAMEDDLGAKTGATNASYYHHVLGSATSEGDTATAGGTASYPTSTTAVYCISCHTDHNYFNANKGKNLRSDIASASGNATANTDFLASGSYGICVSCHGAARAKQGTGTEQASLGATNTPSINGAEFALSAHEYTVGSAFGASAFNANCSKCHSDEQEKKWQTSTYRFGTHWSDSVGILQALGSFVGNPPKEEACFKCHTGTGDVYGTAMSAAATATASEFASASVHPLSKVTCSNCHNVHEATATAPAADPDNTYNVASLATTASINTFCLKCHDGTLPGQTVTGTTLIPYTVSANATANIAAYYATSGHGTTPTVGLDCRDCHEQHGSSLRQLLRTSVSGTNVPVYSDTSDQAQCLACHRGGGAAAAANIARYFPASAYGTAPADMSRSGHRTETNGTLTAGSALPCRICHDPHGGAASGYMLTVRTQLSAGVATLVGDAPGELAMSDADQTTATPVNVRRFCLSCHTDSVGGSGWNGSANASVAAGCQVLGISRTGGVLRLPALPNGVKGHALSDTTYSCYMCHGDDFSEANSVNVHNPASGESAGAIPCYTCHTVYQNRMEDGSGTTSHSVGISRTSSFHHVLGQAGGNDGDAVAYPVSGVAGFTNVFCLSCHIDHNWFSPFVNSTYKRSANLRLTYGAAAPAGTADATNTDFVAAGGVCLGCHSQRLARDNTSQTAEATSSLTPTITAVAYGASAHRYEATSTFTDASTFRANCVKCHDSEIDGGGMERGSGVAGYQTSAYKFSVHYSAARRILGAMGVVISEPPAEERICYKCHSRLADGLKSAANLDWYGKASMSATSQALYSIMTSTYAHKVANYAGLHRPSSEDETRGYITRNRHVECADCHDVHEAQASRHTTSTGTNLVSGALRGVSGARVTTSASNWTSPTAYSLVTTATYEYQICFKCHSGFNQSTVPSGQATIITWGGNGAAAWTDQGLEFSTSNQSYHPVLAALPSADPGVNGSSRLPAAAMRAVFSTGGVSYGGWTNGEVMYCSDCHAQSNAGSFGPHGSAVKWMLKGPNQAWPYTTAAGNGTSSGTYRLYSTVDNNLDTTNGTFCRNCHVFAVAGNPGHVDTNHNNVECVACHIRVPHGGKTSRLLAPALTLANLPARYRADGNGSMPAGGYLTRFQKQASGTYTVNDCNSTNPCYNGHGLAGGETW